MKQTESPSRLISRALLAASKNVDFWSKRHHDFRGGMGWHEFPTNARAGAHASCAGIKLFTHPCFPVSNSARRSTVKKVGHNFLEKLLNARLDGGQIDEAHYTTVKVANFVSACAAIAENKVTSDLYPEMAATAQRYSILLIENLKVFNVNDRKKWGWSPWLVDATPKYSVLATAAAFDALAKISQFNSLVKSSCEKHINHFRRLETKQLFETFSENQSFGYAHLTWTSLPILRTLTALESVRNVQFEDLLNAYISKEPLLWFLNHTEDFQKYEVEAESRSPIGTDYVAHNTTTTLVRAILAASMTGKIHSSFLEFTVPYICHCAESVLRSPERNDDPRFSRWYQNVYCLLDAVSANQLDPFLPEKIPMHINPRVFEGRNYRVLKQGFFITPFNLDKLKLNQENIFRCLKSACSDISVKGQRLDFIRGDHSLDGGKITSEIWRYINESGFCIAICAGANPNVYYEIGIAHTLGKPVLLLGRKGRIEEDIWFDIKNVRYEQVSNLNDSLEVEPIVQGWLRKVYNLAS